MAITTTARPSTARMTAIRMPDLLHRLRQRLRFRLLLPLLAPLGRLYGAGADLRAALYQNGWRKVRRLSRPLISVGNLTVGGTGKTPLVLRLAEILESEQWTPSILTRGYRRRSSEDLLTIEPGAGRNPNPSEVGDEPALLARRLPQVPLVISKDRYAAGLAAEANFKVNVHLLDDGFQHLRLHRDVNILLFDATRPTLEDRLLPYGRLRERPQAARRADLVVVTRTNEAEGADAVARIRRGFEKLGHPVPLFTARTRLRDLTPVSGEKLPPEEIRRLPAFAFCGLGNPEAFFRDLRRWGFAVAGKVAFGDHHRYNSADGENLVRQARSAGAKLLLTTEKDVLNLPDGLSFELPVYVCRIDLDIEDEGRFLREIFQRLKAVQSTRPSQLEEHLLKR